MGHGIQSSALQGLREVFFILYLAVKLGGGWSVINSAYPVYFTKTSDIEIGLKR